VHRDASASAALCRAVPASEAGGRQHARHLDPAVSLQVASRRLEIAAAGGADRRSAQGAEAPMHQSHEAHHPARPLHSPEGLPARTRRLSPERFPAAPRRDWRRVQLALATLTGTAPARLPSLPAKRHASKVRPHPATDRGLRPAPTATSRRASGSAREARSSVSPCEALQASEVRRHEPGYPADRPTRRPLARTPEEDTKPGGSW
jgi:hypothetical protein